MKLILKTIKIFSIVFLTIGFLGCDEDQVVIPKAFAEFTYTINQETGVVKFINTSKNASIFAWTFGDDENSTEINPFHKYEPGTYTVTLVSKNIAGSSSTYEDTIVVGSGNNNGGGGNSGTCTAETAESLVAADFNLTFKTSDVAVTPDGSAYSRVANPSEDAVNSSCFAGKVINSGTNPWDNIQINLASKIDFNANEGFKMKVYSLKAGTKVTMKLEEIGASGNNSGDIAAVRTKTGEWEELTFPFPTTATGKFNKIVIFFDLEANDTDTYYFDDLKLYARTGGGGGGSACTAEATESLVAADFNLTFKTSDVTVISDGSAYSRVANPSEDAVNASCFAGKVINTGTNPWDNVQIDLASKIDFNANAGFKMKVYSLKAGTKVTMKLEEIGAAGNNSGDVPAVRTKTGEWEELTFPFPTTASGKFNKIVIFFDLETKDTDTYYFDDLKLYANTGGGGGTGGTGGGCSGIPVAATSFPVNFESCQSFLSTFNDVGSITTSLDNNPSKSGINTSDFVLRVDKASGTNRWAGFQNPFPSNFDATKTFKFKIYSTRANVVMRFEVNSDPQPNSSGNPGPQFATIVNANTWTEVQIVFTGIPGNNTGLNQLVIKPDNPDGTDGTLTSGDATYYFDDIRLE